MSNIEAAVLKQLAMHDEVKACERGFRWRRGDDETRLWFQPTTSAAGDFGLCATAFVETTFSERWPAPDEAALARLNRRAAFGNFFAECGAGCDDGSALGRAVRNRTRWTAGEQGIQFRLAHCQKFLDVHHHPPSPGKRL